MIEKPESFQQFSEDREDGMPYSDGLYTQLHKKLQETREAVEKSGALNIPMVNWGAGSLSRIHEMNRELNQEKQGQEKEIERIKDAIKVAEKIIKMRQDAMLPEDPELSQIIERYKETLPLHETQASQLAETIEKNYGVAERYASDSRTMGRVELDAYEEDAQRKAE